MHERSRAEGELAFAGPARAASRTVGEAPAIPVQRAGEDELELGGQLGGSAVADAAPAKAPDEVLEDEPGAGAAAPVQRAAEGEAGAVDGELVASRIQRAESGGSELSAPVRGRVADALGQDPGPVRVHADADSDDLARTLGAKAFTSGNDVFFRDGAFDPASPEGFELLVHESTHVVQQAAGAVPGTLTADGALTISEPDDPFERVAYANAAQSTAAPEAG
jgi:hypothetical protein